MFYSILVQYFLLAPSFFSMELLLSLSCLTILPLNLYKKKSWLYTLFKLLLTSTNTRSAVYYDIVLFYSNTALSLGLLIIGEGDKIVREFHSNAHALSLLSFILSLISLTSTVHTSPIVLPSSLSLSCFTYTVRLWPPLVLQISCHRSSASPAS